MRTKDNKRIAWKVALLSGLLSALSFQFSRAIAEDTSDYNFGELRLLPEKSADVIREIMDDPGRAIPKKLFEKARCIAVFPNLIKVGLIGGFSRGNGVSSCRTENSWSEPSFVKITTLSAGAQAGIQANDLILVFLNRKKAISQLSGDHLTLGADASIALGPVGRDLEVKVDKNLSEVLSYSRSKGFFVGVALNGAKIDTLHNVNRSIYETDESVAQLLTTNHTNIQSFSEPLIDSLNRYSER